MYEKDYASLLYENVQAEYDDFIAEMKCKPADEIIESAYQIVIKGEITTFCRDCSPKLTGRQFEALLSSKNALYEILSSGAKTVSFTGWRISALRLKKLRTGYWFRLVNRR